MSLADVPLPPVDAPSDELTQGIAELLDGFGEGCIFVDRDWRIRWMNRAAEADGVTSREALVGRVIWEAVPRLVGTPQEALMRKVMAERISIQTELPAALGPGLTFAMRVFPVRDGLGYSFRDVTDYNAMRAREREQAERQRLLIHELNHRVKNTLATVQSIAHQTLREGVDPSQARQKFVDRLLALSAAHNVLTRENWQGANLVEIAAEALRPYEDGARIRMQGPDARLAPNVAVGLSMALHELATNAAKYGALSQVGGCVFLSWRLAPGGSAIELGWREQGGPPVHTPVSRGFGTRLLTQGLATELGAPAELAYRPQGLVCTLRAPVGAVCEAPALP